MRYNGHEVEVYYHDAPGVEPGWVARIDGHDEPLDYAETEAEAVEHAKALASAGWC